MGADADITVFDLDRVIDRATYDEPLQYSEGIRFVFINGVAVVRDDQLVDDVFPGQAARAPIQLRVWSRSNYPWGKVKLLLPNEQTGALEMISREGETDVLAVFGNKTRRLGVHIENKLASGHFTPYQPEVCAARADSWVRREEYGNYDEWETVLLAPASFYQRNGTDARKFSTFISHEEIAAHLFYA